MLNEFDASKILSVNSSGVEVALTPASVADMFWCMDSEDMREFFNRLGHISTPMSLQTQLAAVMMDKDPESPLDTAGLSAIACFNEMKVEEEHG